VEPEHVEHPDVGDGRAEQLGVLARQDSVSPFWAITRDLVSGAALSSSHR